MPDIADDYFVSNIERVDSVTLLRKDKLLTGRDITWTLRWMVNNSFTCFSELRRCLLQTFYSLQNNHNRSPIIYFLRFTHGITTWPCLNELGPESCSSTMCGACEKGKATTQLQMFGQPYNNNTLATLPPKPEAMLNRVSCFLGTNCTKKLKYFG